MKIASDFPAPKGASGMTRQDWLSHLGRIGEDHGFFNRIGAEQLGLFVQESDVLLVSFDSAARVFADDVSGLPVGFQAVQRRQWSLLSLMSLTDGWFRDPELYAFFDSLRERKFFDSFRQVMFIGFGAGCGHAACSYSAAAPRPSVLVTAPAATLAPDVAGYDDRHRHLRRRNFSQYGYAPAQLQTAREAVILFDPADRESAAHAAQFRGKRISRAPVRFAGPDLHKMLFETGTLMPLLRTFSNHRLGARRATMAMRDVRRQSPSYLWDLAARAERDGHPSRALRVARHAVQATDDPRFEDLIRRLAAITGPAPQRQSVS